MKRNSISAYGNVNDKGGLVMFMGELNAFLKEHKGERIVATFTAAPAGSSEALKGYYFHYVVPMVQHGLKEMGDVKTEQQTEEYLRSISPACIDESVMVDGKYFQRVKDIAEMQTKELIEHIEYVRQFAAEWLSVFIDDPRTI